MGELVTVFESDDRVAISLAKGMLEEAEIPYIVKNEALQELFGYGRMGTGYNPITGSIQIQVDRQYAQSASRLLKELVHKENGEAVHKGNDKGEKKGTALERSLYRVLILLILLPVVIRVTRQWLVGVIALSLVCVLWVIPALPGLFLKRYLHQQGYTWVTLEVAAAVIRKVGRKAYDIPPAHEVETLPGFKRNAESLIAIAKLVDKYKDKLMKSSR